MPGFALQDGDLIAKLLTTSSGGFGLGATVDHNIEGTGTTIGAAKQLQSSVNIIGTNSVTNHAVRLPLLSPVTSVRVYNRGSASSSVFPPNPGQSIDGGAPGAAVSVPDDSAREFMYLGNNSWISHEIG